MTPDQYAQAVREALAGHPDREELLEDLDDHLAEIAAESELPLDTRLGPPEAYAAELSAAYGASGVRRGPTLLSRARAALLRTGSSSGLAGFLRELRPGWWVLRGYALGMLATLMLASEARLVPANPPDWALVVLAIVASVWLGRRPRGRSVVLTAVAANALAAMALLAGFAGAGADPSPQVQTAANVMLVGGGTAEGVANLRPYAKDGTPLTDVYLYDQDGKPFTTRPESFGFEIDRSCGEPVRNRYPLPLIDRRESAGAATATPSACPAEGAADPSATPEPKRSE
ncbi:hypothetical protein AB0K12_24300 [Nonomuraea sp. NPDC049419]|uniref:hypothetical protein n=1 Tax=Nonomuraea sp. NPDC049419 TaxID=3155772 RepID=UPI00341436A9